MHFFISILTFFSLLNSSAETSAPKVIEVTASFSILADFVSQVGGTRVRVNTLVGPDQDAHVFEPTPGALRALKASDIVVYNGLGMEGWMGRLIQSSGFKGTKCIATEGMNSQDPHAWQSLKNISTYLKNIEKALVQISPADAEYFKNNRLAYEKELEALSVWAIGQFSSVPKEKRSLMTSHDAFQFFARDFDLKITSPQGWSTESEPTAKMIARLIDQIKKSDIQALFIENMTNPKVTQQISKETKVAIGGSLYADSLSKSDKANSFVKMYKHNVIAVSSALKKSLGVSPAKRAHKAHKHGSAHLSLALSGTEGELDFDAPGDSIIGFEHEAKSEADKKTQSEALEKLKTDMVKMIAFETNLQCLFTPSKVGVESEEGGHSEVEATFKIQCAKSPKGSKMTFNLQKTFSKLDAVEVQVLIDDLQKSVEAKKSGTVLELN